MHQSLPRLSSKHIKGELNRRAAHGVRVVYKPFNDPLPFQVSSQVKRQGEHSQPMYQIYVTGGQEQWPQETEVEGQCGCGWRVVAKLCRQGVEWSDLLMEENHYIGCLPGHHGALVAAMVLLGAPVSLKVPLTSLEAGRGVSARSG